MNTLTTHKRLADFTEGWHRHPEDEKIVFVSHLETFRAAAQDASCRAAIFAVDEETKAEDRAAFQSMWDNSSHNKPCTAILVHTPETGINPSDHGGFEACMDTVGFEPGDAERQIQDMINFYQENGNPQSDKTYLEIIKKWRTENDNKKHEPHKMAVLNRVFLSGGTILPLSAAGEIQVPEGDFLFMKPWCEHMPERLTTANQGQDRMTIVAYEF